MPELDLGFVEKVTSELRIALEVQGLRLMELTDDSEKQEIIGEIAEEGVRAVAQFASRYIDQKVAE